MQQAYSGKVIPMNVAPAHATSLKLLCRHVTPTDVATTKRHQQIQWVQHAAAAYHCK